MRGYGTTETRRIAAAADSKLPVNCHWSEVTRNSHQLAPIMLGQDQPPGLQLGTARPTTRATGRIRLDGSWLPLPASECHWHCVWQVPKAGSASLSGEHWAGRWRALGAGAGRGRCAGLQGKGASPLPCASGRAPGLAAGRNHRPGPASGSRQADSGSDSVDPAATWPRAPAPRPAGPGRPRLIPPPTDAAEDHSTARSRYTSHELNFIQSHKGSTFEYSSG
jgi:hypothetical protein